MTIDSTQTLPGRFFDSRFNPNEVKKDQHELIFHLLVYVYQLMKSGIIDGLSDALKKLDILGIDGDKLLVEIGTNDQETIYTSLNPLSIQILPQFRLYDYDSIASESHIGFHSFGGILSDKMLPFSYDILKTVFWNIKNGEAFIKKMLCAIIVSYDTSRDTAREMMYEEDYIIGKIILGIFRACREYEKKIGRNVVQDIFSQSTFGACKESMDILTQVHAYANSIQDLQERAKAMKDSAFISTIVANSIVGEIEGDDEKLPSKKPKKM